MKLYYSPGTCSLSPHIVLCEAGIAHEAVKVDLKTKKTESGDDFLAINPRGYVPSLQLDDGSVLAEGPAIVQYLADLAPAARLAPPAGSFARVRLQEWLNFISTELHKGFSPLFQGAPDAWQAVVRKGLASRFDDLAETLARQPYLMGDEFSVADAYLFTVLGWARWVKIDLAPWPALEQYIARIAARPGVQKALAREGLI
ncbi:MAG: glutathione transferase GstA [Azospira sp.]|jgi:glutathione S-transferase|nr:glutathione transferase GstA [Azospira sp.]